MNESELIALFLRNLADFLKARGFSPTDPAVVQAAQQVIGSYPPVVIGNDAAFSPKAVEAFSTILSKTSQTREAQASTAGANAAAMVSKVLESAGTSVDIDTVGKLIETAKKAIASGVKPDMIEAGILSDVKKAQTEKTAADAKEKAAGAADTPFIRSLAALLGMTPQEALAYYNEDKGEAVGRLLKSQAGGTGSYKPETPAETELLGAQAAKYRSDILRGTTGDVEGKRQFDVTETRLRDALGLETASKLGTLGLDQSKFVSDILSRPSDALARLFFQRGENSPVPFVSQADLINRLAEEFRLTSKLGVGVSGRDPNTGGRLTPGPTPGPTQPKLAPTTSTYTSAPPPAGYPPVPGSEKFAVAPGTTYQNADGTKFVVDNTGTLVVAGGPSAPILGPQVTAPTSPFVAAATAPVASAIAPVVAPTPYENPADYFAAAPTPGETAAIVPTESASAPAPAPNYDTSWLEAYDRYAALGYDMPSLAKGGTTTSRLMLVGEKGPELVANPTGAPVGVLSADKTRKAKGAKKGAKKLQEGTLSSFLNLNKLLTQDPVTQGGLIDLSRQATPPGPRDVLAGKRPNTFSIGLPQVPTPRLLNSLSPAELQSMAPRLATEYNATLEDLAFEVQQRFGSSGSAPRARLLS